MSSHTNHSLGADPPVHQDANNNNNVHDIAAPIVTSYTIANLNGHFLDADPPIHQYANNNGNTQNFAGTIQPFERSYTIPNTRNTYHRSLTDVMLWLFANKV